MPQEHKTFSEVWYRVAGQHVSLAPQVEVRRQLFRGETWYLVEDPFNNSFYRLRPAAYAFAGRLRKDKTVEEVWRECLELDPESAPGQDEVIQLLAQLHHANLLHGDIPPDHARIFERYRKRKQRERQFVWKHLMFARFPLWDPDSFLVRTLPVVRYIMQPWCLWVWVIVVALAIKGVLENTDAFASQAMNVLAFENLLLLYAAMVLLKTLHEFGHAYACRALGGEVHTMGLMLLVLSPLPYMDATASWGFRERWKRVTVAAAGMIVEFFVAACAALFWVAASEGAWKDLAFNVMIVASVTTLIFNINPLLRYDGYYILSDLVDIPNLYSRGQKHIRHLCERYLFGMKRSKSPAESRYEAIWFTVYGILAGCYRIVVFVGIIFFVSTQYLLLGIIIALICIISWLILPFGKFVKYLADSPQLQRNRGRALLVTTGGALVLFILFSAIPMPQSLRAPGVLRSVQFTELAVDVEGVVEKIHIPSGSRVVAGTPLVELSNPQLLQELELQRARLTEVNVLWRQSLTEANPDLGAIEKSREALLSRIARLEERVQRLTVRAPFSGTFTLPRMANLTGVYLRRGTVLGHMLEEEAFLFSAIVPQRVASRLFTGETTDGRVRLRGQAHQPISVERVVVIAAEQARLPSAALGVAGGGSLAVEQTDREGLLAAETYFEVRAYLDASRLAGVAHHGHTGMLRFDLPPEPLTTQLLRRLQQLFQTHFSF